MELNNDNTVAGDSGTTGQNPSDSCLRPYGRPRKTWVTQIQDDVGMSAQRFWDVSIGG